MSSTLPDLREVYARQLLHDAASMIGVARMLLEAVAQDAAERNEAQPSEHRIPSLSVVH